MKFWEFKAKAEKRADLYLYGVISETSWSGDEVTPKQFKADLDALGKIDTLDIYINSRGGDVFAGQSIYAMLDRHESVKTVYVDGLAASMASLIAMVGKEIIMPENAMMMIHQPSGIAFGNAADMRQAADALDKISQSMSAVYKARTGKTEDEIQAIMDAETWYTAEEAVAAGFATKVDKKKRIAACMTDEKTLQINGLSLDISGFISFPAAKVELTDPPAELEPAATGQTPLEIYEAQAEINKRRTKQWILE